MNAYNPPIRAFTESDDERAERAREEAFDANRENALIEFNEWRGRDWRNREDADFDDWLGRMAQPHMIESEKYRDAELRMLAKGHAGFNRKMGRL